MIIGLGSDLCDIRRIQKSLDRFGERFTHRVFTEIERTLSERKPDRAASYAKRFAAKEACAKALGVEVHAGHGIDYETVGPVARIPQVVELNIGHFLVGEAIFVGLDSAIRRMRALMDQARAGAAA